MRRKYILWYQATSKAFEKLLHFSTRASRNGFCLCVYDVVDAQFNTFFFCSRSVAADDPTTIDYSYFENDCLWLSHWIHMFSHFSIAFLTKTKCCASSHCLTKQQKRWEECFKWKMANILMNIFPNPRIHEQQNSTNFCEMPSEAIKFHGKWWKTVLQFNENSWALDLIFITILSIDVH